MRVKPRMVRDMGDWELKIVSWGWGLWLRVYGWGFMVEGLWGSFVHQPSSVIHQPLTLSFGVLGEPTFAYSFALLEELVDAPKG